jgi:hypothetical protein
MYMHMKQTLRIMYHEPLLFQVSNTNSTACFHIHTDESGRINLFALSPGSSLLLLLCSFLPASGAALVTESSFLL